MNLTIAPVRRIKACSLERNQNGPFFALEDIQRYSARRSMDATASSISTPDQSSTRHVVEVDKRFTLEEALADKTHGIFDQWFVFRMPRPRWVRQETAVIG